MLNRSFARRVGKSLSQTQRDLLEHKLPSFLLDINKFDFTKHKQVNLEIGLGMGEHFVNQLQQQSNSFFIGCEPYINGIANILKLTSEESNFALWPDDVDIILEQFPLNSIDKIYILFPDPWPKTKHLKRRLINPKRLAMIHKILKNTGELYFATDIYDYAKQVINHIDGLFNLTKKCEFIPHDGYLKTKFHQKAEAKGIKPKFYNFVKIC